MKAKSLVTIFILPLLFGFAAANKNIYPGEKAVAQIKRIIKDVSYAKAGPIKWDPAWLGLPLFDGEQVKTDSKSVAVILFADDSGRLTVRENSIVHIYGKFNDKKMNKNTQINKGTVVFDVKKQEDEEFKFTTPTAVASIRGTEGLFEVADNGESVMILKLGSVDLETKTGKKVTLTAGNTAVFDNQGNATVTPSSENDKKKLSQATSLNTKKVVIETSEGKVVVEYFSDESNK